MVKKTREYEPEDEDEELFKSVNDFTYKKCYEIAKKGLSKSERNIAFDEVKQELMSQYSEEELEEKDFCSISIFINLRRKLFEI